MIRQQDILDRAGEWSLRTDIVEKDYTSSDATARWASPSIELERGTWQALVVGPAFLS